MPSKNYIKKEAIFFLKSVVNFFGLGYTNQCQINLNYRGGIIMAVEKNYKLDNGQACSRAAYIKQEFLKGRSRGDIAKELEVAYYVVYSATVNMYNEAHPQGGSNTGFKAEVISVTEGTREFVKDPANFNGTEVLVEINRADYIRELMESGKTRNEIADILDVAYATVYAATKGMAGTGSPIVKVMIKHPETGAEISRADYIRELFAQGKTRREIAVIITKMTDELCDYSTVWAATKPAKNKEAEVEVEDADVDEDASDDAENEADIMADDDDGNDE